MDNDKQQKQIPTWLRYLVGFSISVAVLLIILYFWKFSGNLADTQDIWGQFGDYVGGILNPLFSLTALFALLYTIKLQSKELHDSTEQLKKSAEALVLQNNVLARQQFETTFFQMLALFNEVVRELEMLYENGSGGSVSYKGRMCIVKLVNRMTNVLTVEPDETISTKYREFQLEYSYFLDHYFRTFYSIINFVDKSNLLDKDKKFYTNIVRDQLTSWELTLLFYNLFLLDDEQKVFLLLVKKYDLLKYLDDSFLVKAEHRQLLQL